MGATKGVAFGREAEAAWLSDLYGVSITKIKEREEGSRMAYYVTVDGFEERVGSLAALMTRTKFEAALLLASRGRSGRYPSRHEPWREVQTRIAALVERVDTTPLTGGVLVGTYMLMTGVAPESDWLQAVSDRRPFSKGGWLHVSLPALEAYFEMLWRRPPSPGEVPASLRRAMWEPYAMNVPREGGGYTKVRVWRGAKGWDDPVEWLDSVTAAHGAPRGEGVVYPWMS